MILAIREWPKRTPDEFSAGEYCGARVAHTDLVKAALQYGIVEAVHLYSDALCRQGNSAGDAADAVGNLGAEFGHSRVKVKSLESFAADVGVADCIAFAAGPTIASYAAVRSGLTGTRFPICSVLHAVRWDNLMATYLYTLLLGEASDTLVATSSAGRRAAETALAEARRFLTDRRAVPEGGWANGGLQVAQIPLGIDEMHYAPRNRDICKDLLNLRREEVVLLYLGRLTERLKADLEPLLVAVRRLVPVAPQLVLIVCGQDLEDNYCRTLREYGTTLGLGPRLRVIPNVTPLLKPVLYSAADIFVSPVDSVQETFGLTLLEAMAAELPIVASDWSGYREIVEDGKTGFLIPTYWNSDSADFASTYVPFRQFVKNEYYVAQSTIVDVDFMQRQLSLLIGKPEMRRQFGMAGRQRVLSQYTWSRVIERYRDLWVRQINEIKHGGNNAIPRNGPLVNYDLIFRHYATTALDGDKFVVPSNFGSESTPTFERRVLQLSDPELLNRILKIARQCQQRPTQLRQLLDGNEMTLRATLWLLKKGYYCLQDS